MRIACSNVSFIPANRCFPQAGFPARLAAVASVKRSCSDLDGCESGRLKNRLIGRLGCLAAGLLHCLLFGLVAHGEQTQSPTSATLTTFRQVMEMTPAEARQHRPVESRAVVTLADPLGQLLFVQDSTAGIYAYGVADLDRLRPGQVVEIKAVTDAGRFSPILNRTSLRVVGDGPLPVPRKTTLDEFLTCQFDSQWVELDGVVRAEAPPGQPLKFDLGTGNDRVPVWVQRFETNRPSLVDCVVRVRGVGGALFNPAGRLAGVVLYATSLDDITILVRPQGDIFEQPVTTARELNSYAVRRKADRRIHVRGVVTRISSSRKVCLRDETGIIHLQASRPASVQSGELVEAAGFPVLSGETPSLHETVFRSLGPATNSSALVVPLDQLLDGRHEHELVSVEGQLVQRNFSLQGVVSLLLESGGHSFAACLPGTEAATFAGLRLGSRLQVTGVVELDRPAEAGRPLVSIWLRSPADVKMVAPPQRRIDWTLVLAIALPGLAGCTGLGWLIVARQRRWRRIQSEFEASQRGLQDSLSARERMAQDLHDNVMQSIFAVGLGLDDCRRKLRAAPDQAEGQLNAAIGALNGALREIRRFIGGLEPEAIGGHEFKAALKSLALTIGESAGQFSIEVHPAAANRLTTEQATQLLNIAKEAMSNSLRHGRASKAVVSLQPDNSVIRLEIADDGVGFDPHSVRDTAGLGLRNIERRAHGLGARLQVSSSPGQGTRIIVELPQKNL